MNRILVLGRYGMLGHVVYETLTAHSEFMVVGCARKALDSNTEAVDVSNFGDVEGLILKIRPDVVINCVGVLISDSDESPGNAILLNSYLPHKLADLGRQHSFKLIQISTDCVFSGSRGNYRIEDSCDGDTIYARTKALGEVIGDGNLTIRTSIIGPELKTNGTGLMDWYLKQDGEINGYSGVYWSGVTTLELAKALIEFIKQDITGLYQFTVEPKISKFDLLRLFQQVWTRGDVVIRKQSNYVCDKSMLNTRKDFSWDMSNYGEMVYELKRWVDDRPKEYAHYQK